MNWYNGFSPEQRMKAVKWAREQKASGLRKRPNTCQMCGTSGRSVSSHSEDYSEPFGEHTGRWALCYICHMMVHCAHRNPEKFARYRADVMAGKRYMPINFSWFTFKARMLQPDEFQHPYTQHEPLDSDPFTPMLEEGERVRSANQT